MWQVDENAMKLGFLPYWIRGSPILKRRRHPSTGLQSWDSSPTSNDLSNPLIIGLEGSLGIGLEGGSLEISEIPGNLSILMREELPDFSQDYIGP